VKAASDPREEGVANVWATPLLNVLEEDTPAISPRPKTDKAAAAILEIETADDALEQEARFSAPPHEGAPPMVA
jgi:hypothetical protein